MDLVDRFGRKIEYLRISVTDRCDLRCSYCLPKGGGDYREPEHWLAFSEIERLASGFARQGVRKLRLTGGEPLLRRNLPDLAARLSAIRGIEDLSLSTNGTRLAKEARNLKAAGVGRINLSLDSLDAARIEKITGRDVLGPILSGIDAALAEGFHLRVNMVLLEENCEEVFDMARFCRDRKILLRLIETMPMGDTGRRAGFVDLQPWKKKLAEEFGLMPALSGSGPARYLQSADGEFKIGFITPLSQHFCANCNRVRLSVDGALHLCLGQEDKFEFRELLRAGISDEELEGAIRASIAKKPERHEFHEAPGKILRFMAATGG